ncbi:MAG TPA: helicase-related protein, partial [Bryobacteraceae bacterium]|nr:helicase-related protein [Bryobacteraceae bacterium]
EAVEDYISDTYEAAAVDKKTAVGFVMTIYRRRLASSFHALRRTLTKRLAELSNLSLPATEPAEMDEDASQDETGEEVMEAEDVAALQREAALVEEREAIQGLLKRIARLGTDTKALKARDLLQEAFAAGYDSALVFTQYTDTMDFLRDFLAEQIELPIGCFSARGGEIRDHSGRWSRCSKEEIKRKLRDGQIKLLVCSDAASEGLNLQTCGVLVNYDLPWNPMKVEQRIGRIDRIGQRYPKVRIINLAYADTVEADVYFALSDRINLFQGLVGKLQPILSKLPKEFEAAALRRREDRERGRHEALQEVQTLVTAAEKAAFDIDEVSDADLAPPSFPPPPLTPEDVAAVLRRGDLLPPGVESQELEPDTFSLCVPGQSEPIRVTASPVIFDDHFESHQLALPDSPVCRKFFDLSGIEMPCLLDNIRSLHDLIDQG